MNNQKQLDTLKAYTDYLAAATAKAKEIAAEHPNKAYNYTEEMQNAFINTITDMLCSNPEVFVQTTGPDADAKLYQYSAPKKNGSGFHFAVMCTDTDKFVADAAYKAIPFVDFMEMIVANPDLDGVIVNPYEENKHVMLKESISYFLQFKPSNIEFIGFDEFGK